MAVPKRKISKQRGNSRSANWKLTAPNLSECSNCHELIEGHKVCPHCGYYKGKPVVTKKQKEE
ncbi:MAG: 50S ribosomal protein L32 [Clostridia bacterium]|jgi:large subunit ribosomal protein L32|nr:50S ribosomal protein L32 [Clostridia bacterium]